MQCVFFVHLGPLFQGDVEAMNLDFVDLARRIHWYNSPNQILSMPSWFIGFVLDSLQQCKYTRDIDSYFRCMQPR